MKPGVDVLVGPGCPVEFLRVRERGREGWKEEQLMTIIKIIEITFIIRITVSGINIRGNVTVAITIIISITLIIRPSCALSH
jgi:hypothetical protein